MRCLSVFVVFAALLVSGLSLSATPAVVSAQTGAQEKAASLRAQLTEVEKKQAELQTRLKNLDEGLKPENIESALAGVSSTRREDVREQRRRQLEIERNGVRAQLDLLATSHSRLETAIASADTDAYRQSAAPPKGPSADVNTSLVVIEPTGASAAPVRPRAVRKRRSKKHLRTVGR